MAIIKQTKQNKIHVIKDVEKLEHLCSAGGNVEWWATAEHIISVPLPHKFDVELLYDPAYPLLDMYTRDLKTGTQTDICTSMFTAAFSQ